jgi:O-antigen biosynthesis protein
MSNSSFKKVLESVSRHGFRVGIKDAAARWARSRTSVPRDVLAEYPWILAPSRPAMLRAPTKGPLRINWILPAVAAASGGLSNIFRTIQTLVRWGHTNRIYVLDPASPTGSEAQRFFENFEFPVKAPVEVFSSNVADSDAVIATLWTTAYAARSISNTAMKFYFVQDVEYRFYGEGSLREFARETYRWGFRGITLGQWIADVLQTEFGMQCSPFGFSYDPEIYSLNEVRPPKERKKRILFYTRPLTERRGFELGVLALSLAAKKLPDVEFVLVGFPAWEMRLPFRAVFPGVLTPSELAALYRTCDLALVLSHTNLSMLPLELMATGCPIVSNRGPNVEWLLKEETTQLADPTPQSIAEAVLTLFEDDELLARRFAAGLAFARQTNWTSEIKKVEDALYKQLGVRSTTPELAVSGT